MTLKIQAIKPDYFDFTVHVDETYYVESDELNGEFKVTYLELIAAPTASGVEVRAEIEVPSTRAAAFTYHNIAIDCILEESNKTMTNAETLAVMDWVHNNPELEKNMLSIYQQVSNPKQSGIELELEWNKWANNQEMKDRLAISQSVGSQWRINWNEISDMIGNEING